MTSILKEKPISAVFAVFLVVYCIFWFVSQFGSPTPSRSALPYGITGARKTTELHSRLKLLQKTCKLLEDGFYNETSDYLRKRGGGDMILTDHYHGVMFCPIKKVLSSSWNALFKAVIDKEKTSRDTWLARRPGNWSVLQKRWSQLNKSGFVAIPSADLNTKKTRKSLYRPAEDYFKFIMVRHPLDRLASAYLFLAVRNKEVVKTSFEQFLEKAAHLNDSNKHWTPFIKICKPCGMDLDYIAHAETLQEDLTDILPKFNATDFKLEFPEKNMGEINSLMYKNMYADVSRPVLQTVFTKYKIDADMFGYSFDEYMRT